MYAPPHVVTNDELARTVETSHAWIFEHTGIERRHIAAERETSASMAIQAARAALQVADADPRELDLVLVATATPDHAMPSTACLVQDALGAARAGAVDLNAGCAGFVYALTLGHQAIASGEHDLVLVVGVDAMSRVVDWQDRNTCVLFGDGAGAVLLRASEGPAGVLAVVLGADGSGGDALIIPAGGSALPASHATVDARQHYLQMNGREVYRFAVRVIPQSVEQVLAKAHLKLNAVDCIIPHQANLRILEAAAKRLNVPLERFAINLQEYGNTSAASVPIALCEAVHTGRIQPGQNLVLVGFGAGLTWAAVALRWSLAEPQARTPRMHNWLRRALYGWARLRTRVRRWFGRLTVGAIRRAEGRKRRRTESVEAESPAPRSQRRG